MKLDAYDLKILAVLQREGRMTKVRLAEAIHLSPSPCWERLRRLEQAGIIRAYHAEVDVERLARISTVWVEIRLKSHRHRDFERFEAAIREVPEVVQCDAVGGGPDYLMKVACRNIDHYQRLIERLLDADPGIERYYTYVVTKPVKRFAGYPLDRLLDPPGAADLEV